VDGSEQKAETTEEKPDVEGQQPEAEGEKKDDIRQNPGSEAAAA